MKKTKQPTATLKNGVEIPFLGLGTWQASGENCTHAVTFALNHGYSHIDTAQAYDNEREVGQGWRASDRPRDDIFLTTKIWNSNQGYKRSQKSFKDSLKALQTDYVDLLLIHWPYKDDFSRTVETWKALIDLRDRGLCRSIGVSNFTIDLLGQLIDQTGVVPATNQVEFHTFLYQKDLLKYCLDKEIQIEAYSPIARAKHLDNKVLKRLAEKYEKTTAQLMLAWGINHDLVVIPKSVHEERILENSKIFFEIEEEDMETLDNLTPQRRLIKPDWAPKSW